MAKHERMFPHEHADKLDDPERKASLPADAVIAKLALAPGARVADIGAGTGYFAIPMARAIAPSGRVLAVDVQPPMLERLRARIDSGLDIALVHGEATRTTLDDASVDLAFLANVWHEIDDREAALVEIARIVRPGGRMAIVDWRPDVERPPGPPLDHRVTVANVQALLTKRRFTAIEASAVGVYHYLVVATAPA